MAAQQESKYRILGDLEVKHTKYDGDDYKLCSFNRVEDFRTETIIMRCDPKLFCCVDSCCPENPNSAQSSISLWLLFVILILALLISLAVVLALRACKMSKKPTKQRDQQAEEEYRKQVEMKVINTQAQNQNQAS